MLTEDPPGGSARADDRKRKKRMTLLTPPMLMPCPPAASPLGRAVTLCPQNSRPALPIGDSGLSQPGVFGLRSLRPRERVQCLSDRSEAVFLRARQGHEFLTKEPRS